MESVLLLIAGMARQRREEQTAALCDRADSPPPQTVKESFDQSEEKVTRQEKPVSALDNSLPPAMWRWACLGWIGFDG